MHSNISQSKNRTHGKNNLKKSMDAFTKGLIRGLGLDVDPLTLASSLTSMYLNHQKDKRNENIIKSQQNAINHLKRELKNSELRSLPSDLLTPKEKKQISQTKAEKELGGYWMLENLKNGYLPHLKKIPKMAAKHKYPEVREAAKAFQNKYGNAQLLPTWFSGQMTMLPKDKAGYIKAHKNIFEQEFMANQRKAENKNSKQNKRK